MFSHTLQLFPLCILKSTFVTICPWQQGPSWVEQHANVCVCVCVCTQNNPTLCFVRMAKGSPRQSRQSKSWYGPLWVSLHSQKVFFAFQHATLKYWCSLPTNASQAGPCRIGLFVPWRLFLGYSALVKCAVLSSSISVAQQRNKGKVYSHQGHSSRDCVGFFLRACAGRRARRSGDVNMLLKWTELACYRVKSGRYANNS